MLISPLYQHRCRCGTRIDYHDAIKQWWHVVRVGRRGVVVTYRNCRDADGNDIGHEKAQPNG